MDDDTAIDRRGFLRRAGQGLIAAALPLAGRALLGAPSDPLALERKSLAGIPAFTPPAGPAPAAPAALAQHLVLVRFGGGVRPRETVDHETSEAPFLTHGLLDSGTLYRDVWIDRAAVTGHAQGTLYLSTGRFTRYQGEPFDIEYTPRHPTIAEYVRAATGGPATDAVLVNNSDNLSTEFVGFSEHPEYGFARGPILLSEWALRRRRFERDLAVADGSQKRRLEREHARHVERLYRAQLPADPRATELLDRLDREYGERPPRGDDLVAELAVRALVALRPRYLQVHLQDADYVHWGPRQLYQRGVRRMDRALERIWTAVQLTPALRDSTAFLVVPDHGRNEHGDRRIPYQHHDTEDPGSHRVFVFAAGPGIARGRRIDQPRPQVDVAATAGALLGVATPHVHGRALEGLFS